MKNGTLDLWIPHSNALPLSHRDSTVSEVYHKVDMTRILHIARISNVDSIIFVDRNKEWSLYGSVVEHQSTESEGLRFNSLRDSEFFLCPTLLTRRKTHLSLFLSQAKNLPSFLFLSSMNLVSQQTYHVATTDLNT